MIPYESCRYSHFSCHTRAVVNRASSFNSCPSLCGGCCAIFPRRGWSVRGQMVFLNDGEMREIRFVYTTLPFDIDVIHKWTSTEYYLWIYKYLSHLFYSSLIFFKMWTMIFIVAYIIIELLLMVLFPCPTSSIAIIMYTVCNRYTQTNVWNIILFLKKTNLNRGKEQDNERR